jgi:RNA polymerase primary sigma factor
VPTDTCGYGNAEAVSDVLILAMTDTLGLYLNDIGKVPLLTALEERELSRAIEQGTDAAAKIAAGAKDRELKQKVAAAEAAKDRFIRANLRLVVSIARRYPLPQGMELSDLIQEGNLGLEHAVDKFDWRRGFKFSTYATFWIRQAIGRALDQKASLIRLPGDRSAALRAALRSTSSTGEELDAENASLHRISSPISLDRPVGDDTDTTLVDLVPSGGMSPEEEYVTEEGNRLLSDLLGTLDDRARYAVTARFGLIDGQKRSFREVGDDLGVTAEAARRMVKRAVEGLRDDAARILAA